VVLGATGMLGHRLVQTLSSGCSVFGTVRGDPGRWSGHPAFAGVEWKGGVEATDLDALRRVIHEARPDAVVNCIGIIKQLPAAKDPIPSLEINALLPHRLFRICRDAGARLVHVSTDCVFSGRKGNYREDDTADADDLYGRTKLLGELQGEGSVTLRTSMIGREMDRRTGLLEWFLAQRGGTVKGFARAIFSGLTTTQLSRVIAEVLERHRNIAGLWHVAADPIDKFTLLQMIDRAFELGIRIERDESFVCDRSLDGSRFRAATGFRAPAWEEMVRELAAESPFDVGVRSPRC
jgi:dTDP-4-dehydrorhamnose reductase